MEEVKILFIPHSSSIYPPLFPLGMNGLKLIPFHPHSPFIPHVLNLPHCEGCASLYVDDLIVIPSFRASRKHSCM